MTTEPTAASTSITETTTEQLIALPQDTNVTDGVLALADRVPDQAVYAVRNGSGGWVDISITTFVEQVRSAAKGLMGLGVRPGDRVAVMSATSYSWAVIDQAIWFAGAVSVPIYETSSAHQVAALLEDSGASLVLIGEEKLRGTVQSAAATAGIDVEIRTIGRSADLYELAESGAEITDDQLETARSSRGLDDVATIVYTSGTTGTPKGVKISHRNLAEGAANLLIFAEEILGEGESRTLLFLPLAHVLARAVQVACLHRGIQVAHTGDTTTLLEDLASYRPTWLLAVPRVFEKVYHSAAAKAQAEGKGKIFDAARRTAIEYSQAQEAAAHGRGPGPSAGLRAKHALFAKLVYSKLLARLGGCVTHMVSGASPLNTEIGHFFTGIGVPVQEGYGLTESTAPITLNVPGATRIGSVGLPVPGNSVKIAQDGEVLLKGPVVFSGYYNAEEATSESFDDDGWFRSGDLGSLDDDGYLTITGRKKELIVTAGGKNVYPTPLEESVRVHPLVAQVVVVGDGRPFVSALVTLDADGVAAWSKNNGYGTLGIAEALAHGEAARALRAEVQVAVDGANEKVSRAESIRKFEILETELSEASGHLTPSMKLQRHKVMEDFAEAVESLYTS
ncbi:AMP-dependent synthetase/ligase [Nesterenkonia flava]|uniref:Acyl-CoA synthetase n=1 Tax=Nesterenkonia flava TaxID=469799 RepID=A0ABU1FQ31_9MICC|nr:AMP-dependent synthetase/ligase [Nesterenkonia flava]MDR5710744.1 AMP-dependent synthetase/ligase [Nesterenkonia flava]